MNLATETDVKLTPKKAGSSLKDKPGLAGALAAAVLPDGNDSSDSKEGTASAKTALVQGAEQNDESSSSSDSEEETAKQVRATAAAKHKASRRKADMSNTSESSDETDIDNPEKTSMAVKAVEALPTRPSKDQSKETTAAQARALPLKAKRSSQILVSETESDSEEEKRPATVVPSSQPKTLSMGIKKSPEVAAKSTLKSSQPADESSTEDSSESDQEPAAKKQATVLQSSQLQMPMVATKQTSVVAKSKSPLKTTQPASESSEEESESDEEPAAKKPATVLNSSQPKTPAGGAKQAPALDKSKGVLKATLPADESSEEESDSDEMPTAKKPATALQSTQPKTPSGGSKQTAAKSKTPVKTPQPDSETSEEDSESDEELASKKPAAVLPSTPTPKTSSGGSKQIAAMAKSKTPVKTPQPHSESSEEDSESDEEPASKEPATALPLTKPKTPSEGSKQTEAMAKSKSPVKAPQPQSESSEEDSESDEEPASKKPATALPSTPKTSIGGSKQTAAMAKSKSPVRAPQPDSENSEEDSESDEQPASKKPAAAFSLAQPKNPSEGSKQTAAMAKSNTPVKTPQPDSESSEEDSESDEEPASKKPAAAFPSVQPKTSSGGSKQTAAMAKSRSPVKAPQPRSESSEEDSESDEEPASKKPATALPSTPALITSSGVSKQTAAMAKSRSPVKAPQPDSESSEEDSESDKKLASKKSATALPSAEQKNFSGGSKLTAVMAKSKTAVKIEQPDRQSSEEDFESDEEPSSMVTSALLKATPPAAKFTVQPAVVAKQKAGGPTKPVPSTKLAAADQETSDSSQSSDGEEQHTGAQVNTSMPTAVKTVQPKVSAKMKIPSVRSPVPGKTNASSLHKPKQPDPKSSSESSDSEEEPAVKKVATPATVKVKQGKAGKVVKTPLAPNPLPANTNGTSMAKTPLRARAESSSDTSESEEDAAEKVPNKGPSKAAEQTVKSPLPSTEVKGKTRSLTQSPAVQKPATASSSSSESEEEPAIKPPAATTKPMSQSSVGKTTPSTVLQKKQESSSEESDSDEEEPLKKVTSSAGKTQKKPELIIRLTKLKSPSPAKNPVGSKPHDRSDEASSDSEDDLPVQGKGAATRSLASSQKPVAESVSKMSSIDVKKNKSAVPPTLSGGCKPEDSQPLLKIAPFTITSPKRRRRASEKASILDSVSEKTKKNKVQPNTIPEPPTIEPLPPAPKGALLESEEETVLALLEGRSPKKTQKKKASKKAADTAVVNVTTAPVQNINVPKKGPLPQSFSSSTWIPESPTSGDDESALPTKELPPLSDEKSKSSKKRKISEDGLKNQKQTAKKAKKDKKEKKSQKGSAEGANVTPKPKADKKKPEKDQSKKKTKSKEGKKNQEEKKKAKSVAPAVVESTDSGIGLSIPKKKRKR